MEIGPRTEPPVLLSKTWSPSFTICTYCVAPTSPLVSGGAQLQATPGNPIPSKFRTGDGIASGARRSCTTVSSWLWANLGSPSGSRFRFLGLRPTFGGMSRNGGETSFFAEDPTVIVEAVLFLVESAPRPEADTRSADRTPQASARYRSNDSPCVGRLDSI